MISGYLQTDPENVFLYWKGRVALYAILKAAGIGKGDEVVISGLTCVVVPNAVKYVGATPVYADVESDTFNPSEKSFKKQISQRTKAIILQNTFGLSSDLEEIVEFAQGKGILTIEDCTHGFGGRYKDKPNGTYCDAAIFSTQWNKPFSTGLGGFSYIRDLSLRSRVNDLNKELIKPSILDNSILALLLWFRATFLNDNNYWSLRSLYRRFSKLGLVIGSSQGNELKSSRIPNNYFRGASSVQAKKGIRSILELDKYLLRRKVSAAAYSDFLKLHDKTYVREQFWDDHSFLVYPLLVSDRTFFMQAAEKHKVKLGDWFISPIHPVTENFAEWDLNKTDIPNACFLSEHLVNLPTMDTDMEPVLSFLKENVGYIL